MQTRSFGASFADINGVACFGAKRARLLCSTTHSPPSGSPMSMETRRPTLRHPDIRPHAKGDKGRSEKDLRTERPSFSSMKLALGWPRRLFRLLYLTIKSIVTHTRSGYVPSITINANKLGQSMGGSPGKAANPCLAPGTAGAEHRILGGLTL